MQDCTYTPSNQGQMVAGTQLTAENSLPTIPVARLHVVRRRTDRYKRLTQEIYRIDWRTVKKLKDEQPLALKQCNTWFNRTKFSNTRHFISERAKQNANCKAMKRNGTHFTNLYAEECSWLLTLDQRLNDQGCGALLEIVELGFNVENQICKVGMVLPLHKVTPSPYSQDPGARYLFICVGMDGGIKTSYVTPQWKDRVSYRGRVSYISLPELAKKFKNTHMGCFVPSPPMRPIQKSKGTGTHSYFHLPPSLLDDDKNVGKSAPGKKRTPPFQHPVHPLPPQKTRELLMGPIIECGPTPPPSNPSLGLPATWALTDPRIAPTFLAKRPTVGGRACSCNCPHCPHNKGDTQAIDVWSPFSSTESRYPVVWNPEQVFSYADVAGSQ